MLLDLHVQGHTMKMEISYLKLIKMVIYGITYMMQLISSYVLQIQQAEKLIMDMMQTEIQLQKLPLSETGKNMVTMQKEI